MLFQFLNRSINFLLDLVVLQYKFHLLILLLEILYIAGGRPDNRPEWRR